MDKIKKWLSVENNFNLIRDCLFILVLLGALLFGYCSLSHTLAAEVPDGFPELPDGKFSLSEGYVKHDFIVYDGTDYHALICKMSESATELQMKLDASSVVNDKMPLQIGPCYHICDYVLLDGTWAFSKEYYYNSPSNFPLSFRYSYDSLKSLVDSEQFLVYGTLPVTARVSVSGDYVTINPGVPGGSGGSTTPDTGDGTDTPTDPTDPVTPVPPVNPDDPGEFTLSTLVTYVKDISTGLFNVADACIDFIIENPICLVGIILFIFVAGAGVTKTYTKGV